MSSSRSSALPENQSTASGKMSLAMTSPICIYRRPCREGGAIFFFARRGRVGAEVTVSRCTSRNMISQTEILGQLKRSELTSKGSSLPSKKLKKLPGSEISPSSNTRGCCLVRLTASLFQLILVTYFGFKTVVAQRLKCTVNKSYIQHCKRAQ